MDLWLVAAATGAGYLAKFWQNLSRDRDGLAQLCSGDSNLGKTESHDHPFRRLEQGKKLGDYVSLDRTVSDTTLSDLNSSDVASTTEVASTSGIQGEKLGSWENYQDFSLLSISNLQPGFPGNENLLENESGNGPMGDIVDDHGDLLTNPSTGETGSCNGSMRNRSSLRTRRSYMHTIKPISSLESCVMAQLYKEHAEMEEYVLSALPSPATPTMRPLLVTDGSRIINRENNNSLGEEKKLHKEAYLEKNVYGVPPLPKFAPLDLAKKMQIRRGKGQNGKLGNSSKMANGKHIHSQGSSDGAILLCLGISIGIIASFVANKEEVDKLKILLKQTENLVQDLHEELEMKDSLTVKELSNENYESQDTCDNSIHGRTLNLLYPEQNINSPTKYDGKGSYFQKADESSESMSKIEAELEAELERLALNVNASTLERRLSDLVELDPDFVADFAQGELRAEMVRGQDVDQTKSNQDESSTSPTHHSGNYAVSPRELSLRLHEVVQLRLEERIDELEAALQNSQRKLQIIESEHKNWSEFPNSQLRFSLGQESSIAKEECNSITEPLVMNLSGEALDVYNEAYEELMKSSESDEEDSPCRVYEHISVSHSPNHVMFESQSEAMNGSMPPHSSIIQGKSLGELFSNNLSVQLEDHISWVQGLSGSSGSREEIGDFNDEMEKQLIKQIVGLSGSSGSREEIGDFNDEMEKQLIKQIVEKTKKGSPAVLNAQKLLFSMDEHEH